MTPLQLGADVIELGVPYSDPLADGPTIQAAATRALQQGATLDKVRRSRLAQPVGRSAALCWATPCWAGRCNGPVAPLTPRRVERVFLGSLPGTASTCAQVPTHRGARTSCSCLGYVSAWLLARSSACPLLAAVCPPTRHAPIPPVQVLGVVREASATIKAPIVMFTYYNPIMARGLDKFCQQAKEAGASGAARQRGAPPLRQAASARQPGAGGPWQS